MNIRDFALIAFTILVQMSVGSMWVLVVVHFFAAKKYSTEAADQMGDRALFALIPVIALAFLASLFHLGNPLNAYLAVTNLGSSWLSREIFFGVTFAILATLTAFFQWRKIGSFVLRNVIAWLAALVGVVLVYSMGHVYMLQAQPAWNSWVTTVSFFVTAILLGTLAMGAAFVANYARLQRKESVSKDEQSSLMRGTLRWLALSAVVLVGVELVILPIYLVTLASGSRAGLATVNLMAGSFGWMLSLRIILAFIGAGVFGLFLYQNALSEGREKVLANFAYTAFVIVLAAEVLGRILFYATHVRIGV